jgi:hypothetical protein
MSTDNVPDDVNKWFRSSDKTAKGTTTISLDEDKKELEYSVIGNMAFFEGDILIGQVAASDATTRGLGITGAGYRWSGGKVPYEIDSAMPGKERVKTAIKHWQDKTPFQFVERTSANQHLYPDYIRFEARDGCWSSVGKQSGKQIISLGAGCGTGAAIHEIGHAIGLWHEQSREDRNKFVTIHEANVIPKNLHNFKQHISDGDDLGKYDYESIMHYPSKAFSKNGQDTIVPKQSGVTIGQRIELSAGDIAAVKELYPTLNWP